MKLKRCVTLLLFCAFFPAAPWARQTASTTSTSAQRDPQGVALLNQALQVVGGIPAVAWVQDFSERGTIAYPGEGSTLTGTVVARGRGIYAFRLDVTVPEGTKSWVVSGGRGSAKESNGTLNTIPYFNAIGLGSLTFPFGEMLSALQDPSTSILLVGVEQTDTGSVYRVRTQRNFGADTDPKGDRSAWSAKDYLIDSTTMLLSVVENMTHPVETHLKNYLHRIILRNYRTTNGVMWPTSVVEEIGGQTIWEIQFVSITFNTALTDSDFQL